MRAFLHNLLTNAREPVEPNLLDTLTLGNKAAGWYKPYAGDKPLDALTPEDLSKYRKLVHRDFTRTSPDSNRPTPKSGSALRWPTVMGWVVPSGMMRRPTSVEKSFASAPKACTTALWKPGSAKRTT